MRTGEKNKCSDSRWKGRNGSGHPMKGPSDRPCRASTLNLTIISLAGLSIEMVKATRQVVAFKNEQIRCR